MRRSQSLFYLDGLTGRLLTVRFDGTFQAKLHGLAKLLPERCVFEHREKKPKPHRLAEPTGVSRTVPTLLLPSFNVERLGYLTKDSWGREETGNWRSCRIVC